MNRRIRLTLGGLFALLCSPVSELKRLVRLARAYAHMNAGDTAIERADFDKAAAEYAAAEKLAPHIVEIPFWTAVSFVSAGRVENDMPIFRRVFAAEPVWADLVPRLVQSGLFPDNPKLLARVRDLAPKDTGRP